MYRAIIPGQFLSGCISSSVPNHFGEKLLQQLAASPRCSEVLTTFSVESFEKTSAKIRRIPVSEIAPSPNNVGNLFIVTDNYATKNLAVRSPVDFVVLSSIFGSSVLSVTLDDLTRRFPDSRISVFKYGRIMNWDAPQSFLKGRSIAEKVRDTSYPLLSQFLPARYREIEAKHLAQAIRLNYETCAPEYTDASKKVEILDFTDCMKIIGLEEKI